MKKEKNQMQEMKEFLGKVTALALSYDTTGSMIPCLAQVRQKLRDLVEMMMGDIPGLKIALISHGDYCDGPNCIHKLDFTDDVEKLMNFILKTPNTSGGDAPECYEFVMHTARTELSWPKEGGSLIMFGDDLPHDKNYHMNKKHIDWQEEVAALAQQQVKVFPVQCLYHVDKTDINRFWEEVSGISKTPMLILESFNDSANMVEALGYASAGKDAYAVYASKFDKEVSTGKRSIASRNMVENKAKLGDYLGINDN